MLNIATTSSAILKEYSNSIFSNDVEYLATTVLSFS